MSYVLNSINMWDIGMEMKLIFLDYLKGWEICLIQILLMIISKKQLCFLIYWEKISNKTKILKKSHKWKFNIMTKSIKLLNMNKKFKSAFLLWVTIIKLKIGIKQIWIQYFNKIMKIISLFMSMINQQIKQGPWYKNIWISIQLLKKKWL